MSANLSAHNLAALASRLTDTRDCDTYAALMSYLNSLPPGDELGRLAELFGLVALLGERVPTALPDAMTELRELTTATGDYHAKVDESLVNLPAEITKGLNIDTLVSDVGEAFRQKLAATRLKDANFVLEKSCGGINALSDHISTKLASPGENYTKIAGTIATERKSTEHVTEEDQKAEGKLKQWVTATGRLIRSTISARIEYWPSSIMT